ncbi:MAG: hypothetical protein HY716_01150 [Planctomycetes bacterium]|nr:hypothetical protein [Planctomycetota bacterium]
MSNVERIEAEIAKLSPEEVRQIVRWLIEYDAGLWGQQMDEDATAGWLDFLFEEADAERKTGRLRDWPPAQA